VAFRRSAGAAGKLIMESVIETKAGTILQFIQGLRGDLAERGCTAHSPR